MRENGHKYKHGLNKYTISLRSKKSGTNSEVTTISSETFFKNVISSSEGTLLASNRLKEIEGNQENLSTAEDIETKALCVRITKGGGI
jgi:hypothetical protein